MTFSKYHHIPSESHSLLYSQRDLSTFAKNGRRKDIPVPKYFSFRPSLLLLKEGLYASVYSEIEEQMYSPEGTPETAAARKGNGNVGFREPYFEVNYFSLRFLYTSKLILFI
jgi:hypothetical protein